MAPPEEDAGWRCGRCSEWRRPEYSPASSRRRRSHREFSSSSRCRWRPSGSPAAGGEPPSPGWRSRSWRWRWARSACRVWSRPPSRPTTSRGSRCRSGLLSKDGWRPRRNGATAGPCCSSKPRRSGAARRGGQRAGSCASVFAAGPAAGGTAIASGPTPSCVRRATSRTPAASTTWRTSRAAASR